MTIKRALVLIVLQALLAFVVGMGLIGPLVLPNAEDPFAPSPQLFGFIALFGGIGAIGLVWIGSVVLPRRSWRELGWHTRGIGAAIALGLAGALAALVIVSVVWLSAGATWHDVADAVTSPSLGRRLGFLCIGIQAAFIEESLFRGNLLPALERRMPRSAALWVSGVVFAVYHLRLGVLSLLTKTLFGALFGALRGRDGSLVAPAVAHGVFWVLAGSM